MIRVQQIKIKVSTNVSKEPFDLTFSKIYDPAPGQRSRQISISEYPFFTADVKYDEKFLAAKPYYEILSCFFDKKKFIEAVSKKKSSTKALPPAATPLDATTAAIPPETLLTNANENVMIMLRLLFPISYPIKNNVNTSYKKYSF